MLFDVFFLLFWCVLWLIGGLLTHLLFAWRVLCLIGRFFIFFGVCVVIFMVRWLFADAFGVCLQKKSRDIPQTLKCPVCNNKCKVGHRAGQIIGKLQNELCARLALSQAGCHDVAVLQEVCLQELRRKRADTEQFEWQADTEQQSVRQRPLCHQGSGTELHPARGPSTS